ncbi:MAG TPA: leucyl aminopeptidase [Polyangiaceae bacterium LLY-WYZ-14_1]|nr:leucyl aminopeptidase [Polyangiaceae bacterium LLY-WYZ-14_1]
MKVALSADALPNVSADLLAVPLGGDAPLQEDVFKELDGLLGGDLARLAKDEGFQGNAGETLRVPVPGDALKARWLLLVGFGPNAAAEPSALRRTAAAAVSGAKAQQSIAVVAPVPEENAVRAAAEGLRLGAYRFDELRSSDTKPKTPPPRSGLVVVDDKRRSDLKKALTAGVAVADCVNVARDLVNRPPNILNAVAMADFAKEKAQEVGLKCTVMTKAQLVRQKMNLFLAVNQGSENEPRLIHLVHKPARPKAKVAFVGKGLTFDSGGLCLKPPKAMADMKCDMAGGAVTIATLLAAAKLKLPIEVHGLIGATDNMTGGGAYRPGDVFTARSGKTVEIINTDAEGRLVLADVLSYATELGADYLIDHATLTGACIVALGPWRAGLYANDDEFEARYREAAEEAGENFWRLPLDAELREMLKSDVADVKHVGDAFGGSITAALFLQEFVKDSRWVHLDIAGPAFQSSPHGLHPKGGTGFGVATALRFLEALST